MGIYKKAVITDSGNNYLARAMAGQIELTISKIVTSSYEYAEDVSWGGATELNNIRQSTAPSNITILGDTQVNIRALFGNENVEEAYMIQNIGLYATDGENEILFAVSQAQTPDQMPAYNDIAPSSFVYNIGLIVSQASAIQTTVNPAGAATVEDLLEIRKELNAIYKTVTVTVPAAWTNTAPYTQEITVAGLKVGDPAEIWSAVTANTTAADAKTWDKMAAMISYAKILEDGKLTLGCLNKKPTAAFQIRLKGVSA